jgi:hypothetical protein
MLFIVSPFMSYLQKHLYVIAEVTMHTGKIQLSPDVCHATNKGAHIGCM